VTVAVARGRGPVRHGGQAVVGGFHVRSNVSVVVVIVVEAERALESPGVVCAARAD
jgi:hypothetical protein